MGADQLDQPPPQFRAAVDQLRAVRLRPEVDLVEVPAPQRIAPFAAALGADVVVAGADVGTGRLVLLHDPAGNDSWESSFRCVTFVRAEVDPEMVRDPVLSSVAWSWLTDAWQAHGLDVAAPSGTVTVVLSEGFGSIADDSLSAQVEVRASWSPVAAGTGAVPDLDIATHVAAWGELLTTASGLAPVPSGVVALPRRHGARG